MSRTTLVASITVLSSLFGACAAAPRPSAREDPAWDDARACVSTATWIDRVEGGLAVAIDSGGEREAIPIADLPPGVGEGAVLIDGAPSPRCAARIRAYNRALRDLNVNVGDTSNAVRLQ